MDYLDVAESFAAGGGEQLQWRLAEVVSVETGETCTVKVAGSDSIAGIPYMTPPRPGGGVWLLGQAGDWIAMGFGSTQGTPPSFTGRGSTQTISNNAWVTVSSWTATRDEWGMESSGVITLPCDGLWVVTASAQFAGNATGLRSTRLQYSGDSGSNWYDMDFGEADANTSTTWQRWSRAVYAAERVKDSWLRMQVWQNSGGNLDLNEARFGVQWNGLRGA